MSDLAPLKQLLAHIGDEGHFVLIKHRYDVDGINAAAHARGHGDIIASHIDGLTVAPPDEDLNPVMVPRDALLATLHIGRAVRYLRGWLELLTESQAGEQETPVVTTQASGKLSGKGKQINERMLATLQKNHESLGWSARQWADALGCSKSSIAETQTWKETIRSARERERSERRE